MAERPILFNTAMVRALLAGTKTQTRRVVNIQPAPGCIGHFGPGSPFIRGERGVIRCPYGQPGDRLWVRETWNAFAGWAGYYYAADYEGWGIGSDDDPDHVPDHAVRWKPSIHMPRSASRILLEVTAVRVERLQDISEADARAEGIFQHVRGGWHWHKHDSSNLDDWNQFGYRTARHTYQSLWEQINGAGSWDANPFVWVVEFKRVMP